MSRTKKQSGKSRQRTKGSKKSKKSSAFFSKPRTFGGLNILLVLAISGIFFSFSPLFEIKTQPAETELAEETIIFPEKSLEERELVTLQDNTLVPISNPSNLKPKKIQRIIVIVTAYSSSPWETDSNPYLTAAGTWVKEGIIANNLLSFGTKVRIPEIYGDKVFVVEDRMHWKKGNYHIDIWFPSYWEALNFGVKRTYIEILEG